MNSTLPARSSRLLSPARPGKPSTLPVATALIMVASAAALLMVLIGRREWQRYTGAALRRGGGRLRILRGAIVGADRRMVMAALGPPRTASHDDHTWYYPIDPRRRLALAIEFVQGIARRTHLLKSPSGTRRWRAFA